MRAAIFGLSTTPRGTVRASSAGDWAVRASLLLVCFFCGRGAIACSPSSGEGGRSTTVTRVEVTPGYGGDRVTGLLHVTAKEAYLEYGSRRIRVVGAPPVTAVGLESLLARTADEVRRLDGDRVRALGDLQGDILWGAQITRLE
jgi:hypothetical protein